MTDDDDDHRRHDYVLHVVNWHLSGGAAPERRLRQINDGLEQIRKWTHALKRDLAQRSKGTKKRPPPSGGDADGAVAGDEEAERMLSGYRNAGIAVCGDFKSDGNTAVRRLLVVARAAVSGPAPLIAHHGADVRPVRGCRRARVRRQRMRLRLPRVPSPGRRRAARHVRGPEPGVAASVADERGGGGGGPGRRGRNSGRRSHGASPIP